jgi:hypothetical protein
MNYLILIMALFLIIFEQVPDGLALAGHKTLAGIIEFIYLSGITMGLFAWQTGLRRYEYRNIFLRIIGGYILLRFALADLIFNLSAGLPLFYIGTTKIYDKILHWFFAWSQFDQVSFLAMFKFIALCIGLSWLLKKEG